MARRKRKNKNKKGNHNANENKSEENQSNYSGGVRPKTQINKPINNEVSWKSYEEEPLKCMKKNSTPIESDFTLAPYEHTWSEFVIPQTSRTKPANRMALKFDTEIDELLKIHGNNTSSFQKQYLKWKVERRNTIMKLEELVEKVHKDQMMYNNNKLLFKEINVGARRIKTCATNSTNYFASLATLVTDAVGGINSFAQAFNVDGYMAAFGEIMEKDAENTKLLYVARSNCFEGYKDVEEIVRRYHSETFGSTLNKISDAINTEEMWLQVKNTRSDNVVAQVVDKVDAFFQHVSRDEVYHSITSSAHKYLDSNPAVLEVCESAGKVLYDIYDTYCSSSKIYKSVASQSLDVVANRALVIEGESEISRLRKLVNDDEADQTKLESKIKDAIWDLEKEETQMKQLYEICKSFKNPKSSSSFEYFDTQNYYDEYLNEKTSSFETFNIMRCYDEYDSDTSDFYSFYNR